MQSTHILTPLSVSLGLAFSLWLTPVAAQAPGKAASSGNDTIQEMKTAFAARDTAKLTRLLPAAKGHPLEGWAAYWELAARLRTASSQEVDAFLAQWHDTYYEDRLRNDWLLTLGSRRAWSDFDRYYSHFRMQDDPQAQCYEFLINWIEGKASPVVGQEVLNNWYGQRNADDGCSLAAAELYSAKAINDNQIWERARIGAHNNRPAVVRSAVLIVAPQSLAFVNDAIGKPEAFLANAATETNAARRALVPLALTRLASSDHVKAANLLETKWAKHLSEHDKDYVWGSVGRWAGIRLSDDASSYFAKISNDEHLLDEQLQWKVRSALRAGNWAQVDRSIKAMSPQEQQKSTWAYWRARAILATNTDADSQNTAVRLMQNIAGTTGFYEQLAYDWLGGKIHIGPEPAALSAQEKSKARSNPSLQRAIYAIQNGLRSEGVREWNYATNLHDDGGMQERELFAAAEYACEEHVWDRCINTSERTNNIISYAQRYPMPFQTAVVKRTGDIDLDPAYVYGLIRQESRFIMDARSGVGASGLMQVMPATASWTAKKIGLTDFRASDINDKETNITIGTAYLKLALDEFAGSMPLAAAAYNAGPGRPRNWRNGPVLEAAIWAENIPFNETRDYVQKVLANATVYSAILTGQPQSLQARLGKTIGPLQPNEVVVTTADLP